MSEVKSSKGRRRRRKRSQAAPFSRARRLKIAAALLLLLLVGYLFANFYRDDVWDQAAALPAAESGVEVPNVGDAINTVTDSQTSAVEEARRREAEALQREQAAKAAKLKAAEESRRREATAQQQREQEAKVAQLKAAEESRRREATAQQQREQEAKVAQLKAAEESRRREATAQQQREQEAKVAQLKAAEESRRREATAQQQREQAAKVAKLKAAEESRRREATAQQQREQEAKAAALKTAEAGSQKEVAVEQGDSDRAVSANAESPAGRVSGDAANANAGVKAGGTEALGLAAAVSAAVSEAVSDGSSVVVSKAEAPNTLSQGLEGPWQVEEFVASQAAEANLPAAKGMPLPKMLNISSGRFRMGDLNGFGGNDEGPLRLVQVAAFKMAATEVSFELYDLYVQATGARRPRDEGWGRGNRPVIDVSWKDAQAFIAWLNNETGMRFRLPSEAEWEYAARAGTASAFNTGNCISTDQANYNGRYDFNLCGAKTGVWRQQTLPVGSLLPNAFGLFDMHGNAWEWVQDCWSETYAGAPSDGSARDGKCRRRVLRGGSWLDNPEDLRAATRFPNTASNRYYSYSFRLASDAN